MTPILHIRKVVFQAKQTEFAQMIGVGQASVSRWENGECSPSLDDMKAIRDAAKDREIDWNDGWFFAIPEVPA